MNDNQIWVEHTGWVYKFMGIILEAQVSFIFSLLRIIFKNLFQILVIFKPYCGGRKSIEKALHANECVRWIDASLMRKGRTFLIPDAKSCIDCEHPIKDDPDLQWMPLFISHTHLYVVLSLWRSLPPHRVWKSPKSETNFWKECIKSRRKKRKKKDTCASKIVPIKLYTHLLCATKM